MAFENALAVGADVIEFDLHSTADGVVVVIHDDTVDRTTDGTGAVAELTFAELRTLDAGYAFTPDGGRTFPYREMGIRDPDPRRGPRGVPRPVLLHRDRAARAVDCAAGDRQPRRPRRR